MTPAAAKRQPSQGATYVSNCAADGTAAPCSVCSHLNEVFYANIFGNKLPVFMSITGVAGSVALSKTNTQLGGNI